MATSFNDIPATRVQGQYAEFAEGAPSGLSLLRYKALSIGQATDAGTKPVDELNSVKNADQSATFWGRGSMLHRQAIAFFANNTNNEFTQIAVSKDPIAVATSKSVGEIQFTAAATADGELVVYIAGERIAVTISSGDSVSDMSAALAAEIAASHPNLPVKSTDDTVDTVDFEALNLGVNGDDIDIRLNYNVGEELPAGVAVTIVAMNAGAATPALTSLITALGDTWFQLWTSPYVDATNLLAIETELDRRFLPVQQIDGVHFSFKADTASNLVTWGSSENSKQSSVAGMYGSPTEPVQIAAAVMAKWAQMLSTGNGAESKPAQTMALVGVLAPKDTDKFTFTERDSLLNNGVATIKADDAGTVRIERSITTYQKNAASAVDLTWLDVNTRFTAMFIRWDWVNYIGAKYPQAKLGDDTKRVGGGQKIMTPAVGRSEAVARFALWESVALVEDEDFFKANLISERNISDVNAMDWFLPCDFVNQFRVGKTQIEINL